MTVQRIQFNSIMGVPQRINPEFAKVKIHVLYTGLNRNGSFISKECVENMLPTLFNTPVVGEWVEENDNFGGHGGKLEITDRGMKYIDTTSPFGVIPSDTEITWERIREKDGITEHEYLTCTAFLWVGRYPVLNKILENGANQSMEIAVNEYHFDDKGVMVIDDANFSALCILGKDSDPDKNYEPCFESADIYPFALNKEQFISQFNLMITELKNALNEGGVDMQIDHENYDTAKSDGDIEIDTVVEEIADTTSETKIEAETFEVEEVTNNDIAEEVVVEQDIIEDKEEFALVDEVKTEENKNIEETQSKQIFELNKQITTLQSTVTALETELIELREYKKNNESVRVLKEKEAVFSEYSIGLTDEEMKSIKDNINDLSISEIKNQLNEVFTKKNLAELKKQKFEVEHIETEIKAEVIKKDNTKSRYAV